MESDEQEAAIRTASKVALRAPTGDEEQARTRRESASEGLHQPRPPAAALNRHETATANKAANSPESYESALIKLITRRCVV